MSNSTVMSHSQLLWAHPLVREWFVTKFGTPTEPQESGWPSILAGQNTLISAPTGSGKTFAAFLACIDQLVRKALSGDLKDQTEVVYISPLKALSNDIQKNLEAPLAEIQALAHKRGLEMAEIRAFVRTGDTLTIDRQKMLKKPPHILVTTPESLYILLTADKSRKMLENVETVIVDEIHAIADDKRGAHLTLTLERLDHLSLKKPIRIGLSATQKPIELVGRFLVGNKAPLPEIVAVGLSRYVDVGIEVPGSPLEAVASNEVWKEIYDRLVQLVEQNRSTLVFVNTRKQAERIAMHLGNRLGEEAVAAHHGSLSRKIRLKAEQKLKDGEIKVLVATASLELGIDIGFVDLVCQISSPRAISAAIQRIGRAGHWRGAIPKGRFFATTIDDLVECCALVHAIRSGELDKLMVPIQPLDILAQQIVAMCSCEEWNEEELFSTLIRAYPYKDLNREKFESILTMLSDGIASSRGRYGAHIMRDQVNGVLKGRRGARLAAIMGGGAIPETALFQVVAEPDGLVIGTLDEDFAVESHAGDIFLLGNTSWRVRRVMSREAKVSVEDAHGQAPTVPFWLGEGPSRTLELSHQLSELRQLVSDLTADVRIYCSERPLPESVTNAIEILREKCGLDESGAEQLIEYIITGRVILGAVPTENLVIAERFFDEGGGMQLIIHSPFGGRINRAWGLALRKKFCRSFNFELQAAATDNGINIALAEQHSFPLGDVFYYLTKNDLRSTLEQAALQSPVFATRFRWDAARSLALSRFSGGKKIPPNILRMRSDDLMAAVFPQAAACQDNVEGEIELPDHPLIEEVMKDVLTEFMDLEGLERVIGDINSGKITCLAVDTPLPSVFSHEILNANPYAYLDDAPLEERRARAVVTRRGLPDSIVREIGALDQKAIDTVCAEVWPDLRDSDEFHDFLLTVIALPLQLANSSQNQLQTDWGQFFSELQKTRRATKVKVNGREFYVATERLEQFKIVYPEGKILMAVPRINSQVEEVEAIIKSIVGGWMQHLGPTNVAYLTQLLDLDVRTLELALLQLEASGSILRGKFTADFLNSQANVVGADGSSVSFDAMAISNFEWCDRRILARIHHLTVATLRKQVEPVTALQYMHWLAHFQHVAPGSLVSGERGTLEILRQLQGFEAPANVWEKEILARRVVDYSPRMLDKLCLNGSIGWGRLSPHPALLAEAEAQPAEGKELVETDHASRRITPTSVAPVTFFVREDADWMASKHPELDGGQQALSVAARAIKEFLRQRGASFFADIVRGNSLLKSEVEMALWELVAAGLVTADGFDNLRSLIDPKRRTGQGRSRARRPRDSSGRWSLLYADAVSDRSKMAEATCMMLLNRYGVVFRDLLARESISLKWRELLQTYRLMEARGEIRGGRFVNGFLGEQFALPQALESLRVARLQKSAMLEITLSASDPLNLQGIIMPGARIASHSGKHVIVA